MLGYIRSLLSYSNLWDQRDSLISSVVYVWLHNLHYESSLNHTRAYWVAQKINTCRHVRNTVVLSSYPFISCIPNFWYGTKMETRRQSLLRIIWRHTWGYGSTRPRKLCLHEKHRQLYALVLAHHCHFYRYSPLMLMLHDLLFIQHVWSNVWNACKYE